MRLLMLLPAVTVFHLHKLLCSISLSLSLSLSRGSVTIMARIFQIVSPSFGVHLFCTMGCLDVTFRFVCPKLYLVHLVRPFRKSVSSLDSDVGGLYVSVYG